MQYRFWNWLADAIGRWGVRLLKFANWLEPPPSSKTIDWSDCAKPHYSVRLDAEQTETATIVDMPRGTFTGGILRRRSDPPPRGQA